MHGQVYYLALSRFDACQCPGIGSSIDAAVQLIEVPVSGLATQKQPALTAYTSTTQHHLWCHLACNKVSQCRVKLLDTMAMLSNQLRRQLPSGMLLWTRLHLIAGATWMV